ADPTSDRHLVDRAGALRGRRHDDRLRVGRSGAERRDDRRRRELRRRRRQRRGLGPGEPAGQQQPATERRGRRRRPAGSGL
ncbi:MAG: hypothetical protein AVDCRST_MAG52-427, partial [uncultured Blastococcus sp.]